MTRETQVAYPDNAGKLHPTMKDAVQSDILYLFECLCDAQLLNPRQIAHDLANNSDNCRKNLIKLLQELE